MGHDEPETSGQYFGDYPHGAYWSAIRSGSTGDRAVDEERYLYEGDTLRIMWDEGAGPLWGDGGLLGEDSHWMRRALGLSDTLIDDLLTWQRDMTAFNSGRHAVSDWSEHQRRLDHRGNALAERLNEEVGTRFRVWYHA